MFDFWAPRQLATAAPDAKILVLLRDPLDRYRSRMAQLNNAARRRHVTPGVGVPSDSLTRGLYSSQLSRLVRYFPRERILVLQLERCREETASELRRTYEFLGLEQPDFFPKEADVSVSPRSQEVELPASLEQELVATFGEDVRRLLEIWPDLDPGRWPSVRDFF